MWCSHIFKDVTYNFRNDRCQSYVKQNLLIMALMSSFLGMPSMNGLPQSVKYCEYITEQIKLKELGIIDCSCILWR